MPREINQIMLKRQRKCEINVKIPILAFCFSAEAKKYLLLFRLTIIYGLQTTNYPIICINTTNARYRRGKYSFFCASGLLKYLDTKNGHIVPSRLPKP